MVDGNWQPVLGYLSGVAGATEVPDAALVERFVRARDDTAFATLVERHGGLVYGVCSRVLRHAADAEDAFQATFLVLARKAASLGTHPALAGWLHRVALRIAVRERRRGGPRPVSLTDDPAAPEGDPGGEASTLVAEELDRLSERYRLPVVLCYLQGRTYDEAARELGCSPGTVNRRLARAREMLRARLEGRGFAPSAALAALEPAAPTEVSANC